MTASSGIRRIVLLALLVASVAASVTIIHVQAGRDSDRRQVIQQQPVAKTENQQALPSQAQPSNGNPDAAAFASIAEREVRLLKEGITLAKWMDGRGKAERWESTKPEMLVSGPDEECLSLRRRDSLPSGAIVVRALYFYPPPVPSSLVFPKSSGSALLATCTLAWVRVEVEASTPEFARAMTQAVSRQFTKIYGDSVGTKGTSVAWGEHVSRWVPHAEIIADYDAKPGLDPTAPGQLLKGPVVRVFAQLPDFRNLGNRNPAVPQARSLQEAQFRRAVAAAGIDAEISQRMEKLYEIDTGLAERLQAEAEEICKTHCVPEAMPKPTGSDWREPLVPLLQDWFKALKAADAGHRAAALLAADSLLTAFGSIRPGDQFGTVRSSSAEQSKLRSALQELGATFEPGFADGFYGYSRNWLNEAKDLDLDSDGGRLALVTWMSNGGSCQLSGSDNFRKIISLGETLLAKKVDASTAAQVHFMVGDAYSDMVAIAGGVDPNGDYSSVDLGNDADSRARALQHYRAGLALDNTSENAKDAWRQAWHLAAGLVPHTRYACFGD